MTTHESATDRQDSARRAIDALYATDLATQANGMRIVEAGPGRCTLRMAVRPDMTNGHGTCHGGVLFMLADSAFAFACNSLTAAAAESWRGGRSGIYDIVITNQRGERVALFRGRSHRLSTPPKKSGEPG